MSTFQSTAVAAAIAAKLPFNFPVIAQPTTDPGAQGDAVLASFTGNPGAVIAIQIDDPAQLADGSADAAPTDRLHPVLEAATSVLGAGVLGEPVIAPASEAFLTTGAQVFDLVDEDGTVVARVSVKLDAATGGRPAEPGKLSRIAGVEMDLTVEIGRTRMPVRDVLGLEPGRVVELDRAAGSPADILLNGRLIGHGTVVVVDQEYAVRVERILEDATVV